MATQPAKDSFLRRCRVTLGLAGRLPVEDGWRPALRVYAARLGLLLVVAAMLLSLVVVVMIGVS